MHEKYEIVKVDSGEVKTLKSKSFDLYTYGVYTGKQVIKVNKGDSLWLINSLKAEVIRGNDQEIQIDGLGVIIRGYVCENKTSGYESMSNLPYVNGCSSHQVFPPVRIGDPTIQLLYLPPNTTEQEHHIHSTVRVVYVARGNGWSVQGMHGENEVTLNQGDVLVLDKMTPHHFRTTTEELVVIPLHIYSSTPMEYNHPMFNGTFSVEKRH
jgi:uncharacterized RmlC-like cupin family protein